MLITSRHGVRDAWNDMMLRKASHDDKKTILSCPCVEYVGKRRRPLTVEETALSAKYDEWELSSVLPLANGSLGTVEKIYLDPHEAMVPTGVREHTLQYPPKLVLFRPNVPPSARLKGLPEGVLPIEMHKESHDLKSKTGVKTRIYRQQFALTPAYAFTDYKSQGQTVSPVKLVIIDLAKPPTGKLSQFNAYVALSRSKSREHVRLLRDFETKLIMGEMDGDLRYFDEWLLRKDSVT